MRHMGFYRHPTTYKALPLSTRVRKAHATSGLVQPCSLQRLPREKAA